MELFVIILGFALFALLVYLSSESEKERKREVDFIHNHKLIHQGMSKKEVIDLLGRNYTKSVLKSGIEKLEWRYRHNGYTGRVAKGAYVHSGAITRRISVKFVDGKCIEINCLNMEM